MRGKPKTAHINVRMTPEERAAIMARSSLFGMTPSAFMRESALLRDEKPVKIADSEELRAMRTDLKRIGNLLNQAVRLGHTYGLDEPTTRMLENAVRGVSDSATRISKLLAFGENWK